MAITDQQLEEAVDQLERAGSYYTLPDGSKVQGRQAATAAMAEHLAAQGVGDAPAPAATTDAVPRFDGAGDTPEARGYIGALPPGRIGPPLNPSAAARRAR